MFLNAIRLFFSFSLLKTTRFFPICNLKLYFFSLTYCTSTVYKPWFWMPSVCFFFLFHYLEPPTFSPSVISKTVLFSRVLRDSKTHCVGPCPVGPSIRWSVSPSVCPSVGPSVHHTLLFLGFCGLWRHCSCPKDRLEEGLGTRRCGWKSNLPTYQ